jgi:hypothetical protein
MIYEMHNQAKKKNIENTNNPTHQHKILKQRTKVIMHDISLCTLHKHFTTIRSSVHV